jgi:outer membrane beta-barrel protein
VKSTLFVLLGLFLSISARAEMIEFPEEELATESVLPVFDNPVAVKNRNVVTAKRFEIGGYAGYDLTEPFYNQLNLGASATYHFDEIHGVNLYGGYFMDGLQSSGESLKNISGTADKINLQYGPHTEWLVDANYQHTAFYGKISLTKDYVMNISIAGLAGLGMINIGGKAFPLASFGVGQKFYFSKSLALRVDMRFLIHQAPNVVGGTTNPLVNATSDKTVDQFEKRIVVGTLLSTGLVFLIPNS